MHCVYSTASGRLLGTPQPAPAGRWLLLLPGLRLPRITHLHLPSRDGAVRGPRPPLVAALRLLHHTMMEWRVSFRTAAARHMHNTGARRDPPAVLGAAQCCCYCWPDSDISRLPRVRSYASYQQSLRPSKPIPTVLHPAADRPSGYAKFSLRPHQCLRLALTAVRLIRSRGSLTGARRAAVHRVKQV